jgi:hypothetical protein
LVELSKLTFNEHLPMRDGFNEIADACELPGGAIRDLLDWGFVVIPGALATEHVSQYAGAYDLAVASAVSADLSIDSGATRVHDFVNCGAAFDPLYVYRPILEACYRVIGQPFMLSSLLARMLRPHSQAHPLHVDCRRDADGWPMVGFIVMVDDFQKDNGVTRFVPGSHMSSAMTSDAMKDLTSNHQCQVLAWGAAGSVIVYTGSVWHGHTANAFDKPRRSIQGASIRLQAAAPVNLPARMHPETLSRIIPLANMYWLSKLLKPAAIGVDSSAVTDRVASRQWLRLLWWAAETLEPAIGGSMM